MELFKTTSSDLLPILVIALAATGLSLASAYQSVSAPLEITWQFTPIGLLEGIREEWRNLLSYSAFAGPASWRLDYLKVFLTTCFLESPFYWVALSGMPALTRLRWLLIANLATHPAVFFLFPWLFKNFLTAALSAEFFAAFTEMLVMFWACRASPWRTRICAGVLIVGANLFSWQMGAFV